MKTVLKLTAIGVLLLAGLIFGLLLMLRATDAHSATMACGKAQEMLEGFRMKYAEVPQWRGTTGAGTAVVILAAPSGTWTALQIKDDIACVVSSGDKAELAKQGQPA